MNPDRTLFRFLRRKRAPQGRPPLDTEGVLWVAALQLVPIEDRVEWVARMKAYVERINADRAHE